ncbi:hypothetical protein [Paenibacillus sp. RC67]|uniref:hypothetical protein n=1 Tax=Paenibacillus sp. RC67 TaxID=3039392 RepID=UPI0024AC96D3|nr:hypothetical protein [Paenibacillus sp. RC67]
MNKFFQGIGVLFTIIAGILYTVERLGYWIAIGLSSGGYAVHSGNGSFSSPQVDFTDNPFVVIFLILGIVMFLYGIKRKLP